MRGLRGFDGPCVTTRSRATTRQLRRGGLPPSLAPLVHNPFAPACRGRACPARSLAITAPLSLASQGGSSPPPPRRPEGWPPYVLPVDCCLPAGRRGRRPLQASLQAFPPSVGDLRHHPLSRTFSLTSQKSGLSASFPQTGRLVYIRLKLL